MKLADIIMEELWFSESSDEAANEEAKASLAARLAQSEGLKTFPVVAQKILSMFYGDNFRVRDITRALEEDPSLATGVLRMANSAYFAPVHPITDLNLAFVRVGAKNVKEIVCALATMNMFRKVTPYGMKVRNHMATVAGLAQFLARTFAPSETEGLFLAGLLHDMGKLMLLDSREMDYPDLTQEEAILPDSTHMLERARLGYDHAVLAGHILQQWNFGEDAARLVAWHHQPSRAFDDPRLGARLALLRLADQVDFILYLEDEEVEEHQDNLAALPECDLLGITRDELAAHWTDLYKVRLESLTTFNNSL